MTGAAPPGGRRVLRLRRETPKKTPSPPADTLPRIISAATPVKSLAAPGAARPGGGSLDALPFEEARLKSQEPFRRECPGEASPAQSLTDALRRQSRRMSRVEDFWEELT